MSIRLITALSLVSANAARRSYVVARIKQSLAKAKELDRKAARSRFNRTFYQHLANAYRDTADYWERQL